MSLRKLCITVNFNVNEMIAHNVLEALGGLINDIKLVIDI